MGADEGLQGISEKNDKKWKEVTIEKEKRAQLQKKKLRLEKVRQKKKEKIIQKKLTETWLLLPEREKTKSRVSRRNSEGWSRRR